MDDQSKIRDLDAEREAPDNEALTTNQGIRVADNQNSLKVGARGPTLLEDFILREKITHFDHERIPERVVHARGSAAHGFFQVYEPLSEYTTAHFLNDPAARTPVFVRFSTVAGFRGSADTVRDVRGFAVKFYTDQGVFDLVGNNIPIFFIQDATKFPDLIHAVKPEPDSEIPQAASAHDTFWDFISLTPESMHMIMWHLSDRAIPRSYRMMDGFGVNTYRFINARGKSHLVKFHWRSLLGAHSLVWDEAQKIAGKDSDFHRRDLWEAIAAGAFPEYEFAIQVIDEADERKFEFDPLDATKIWPEALVPLRRVGKLTLNRNPDNFFAETEQVAFCPSHMVPGIDFSNDPLLQGRLFSYLDTQLSRLGSPNFAELPINRPVNGAHNNQRDGHMRHTINTARTSYQPNSIAGGCPFQAGAANGGFVSFGERIDAQKIRERSDSFRDHFSQATLFWNSQSAAEKEHIVLAFRFELGKVNDKNIRRRMVDILQNVDGTLAAQVAAGIGVPVSGNGKGLAEANKRLQADWEKYGVTSLPGERRESSVKVAPELSMAGTIKDTIKSRRVAILVADGFASAQVDALRKALTKGGAMAELIAPTAMVKDAGGKELPADKTLLTVASVLYDAVFVPGGAASVATLQEDGDAVHFVNEAFKHGKAIAAAGEGADLLAGSAVLGTRVNGKDGKNGQPDAAPPAGVVIDRQAKSLDGLIQQFTTAIAQHRFFDRQQKAHVPA